MEQNSNLLGEVTVDFNSPFSVPDSPKVENPLGNVKEVEEEDLFDPITGEPVSAKPDDQPKPKPLNEVVDTNEEEEEEDDSKGNEVDDTDDNQKEYDEYSTAALLALKAQKSGYLPEDAEVSKDLDFETLMTTLYKTRDVEIERAKTEYLEGLDKYRDYVEVLMNGGSEQDLTPLAVYDQILATDLESEENQKAVLTYKYQSKGLSKEETESLVEDHLAMGKGKEISEAFKQEVNTAKSQYVSNIQKQDAERKRAQLEAEQKAVENVKTIIGSGKVVNYELNDSEQKALEDALFKPTEVYEYVDDSGNTRRTKVTKYDMLQHKLSQSPEMQLAVLKFMMDGFKASADEVEVRNSINDEINAALSGRSLNSKPSRNNRNKRSTLPKDAVILGSKYLGELNI